MDQNKLKLAHEELKELRKPIYNVNASHKESLNVLEKIAVKITEYVGSMGFFLVIFVWTLLWLGWNTIAPNKLSFDPFPAFVFMASYFERNSNIINAVDNGWSKSSRSSC